jgi:hypothetical protein
VPKGLRNLLPTMKDLRDCRFAFRAGIGDRLRDRRAARRRARPSLPSSPTAWRRRSPGAGRSSAPASWKA